MVTIESKVSTAFDYHKEGFIISSYESTRK